jgi:hypothetical protein
MIVAFRTVIDFDDWIEAPDLFWRASKTNFPSKMGSATRRSDALPMAAPEATTAYISGFEIVIVPIDPN